MKNFEDKVVKVISKLACDACGEQAHQKIMNFMSLLVSTTSAATAQSMVTVTNSTSIYVRNVLLTCVGVV
ncbi:MAG: hypothetical protein JKX78_07715 [Alteromonadaceae bacterium]|nr:hypothetical protein [Alteromonadaceae bacterium]